MDLIKQIKEFNESENPIIGLLRDIIFVVSFVAIFASISQLTLGMWTPMVAVESGSMIPHIQIGDIIFIQNKDRTEIVTYDTGKSKDYKTFDSYGDVILYKPFGKDDETPIIHRAMYYVEKGEPMWKGGPLAPHSGYITKGDNPITNSRYDQQGDISPLTPIKDDWVIGAARFYRIPMLGYISIVPRKVIGLIL